jgi:hypothetical protein
VPATEFICIELFTFSTSEHRVKISVLTSVGTPDYPEWGLLDFPRSL